MGVGEEEAEFAREKLESLNLIRKINDIRVKIPFDSNSIKLQEEKNHAVKKVRK